KTDVGDAEWIAERLQHGLLKASFGPPAFERHLRERTRYRTSLINERTRSTQRLQKTLESATIKLASVVSDIHGVYRLGRCWSNSPVDKPIPSAGIAGQRGRLREKRTELEAALRGRIEPHHRLLIMELLAPCRLFG